MAKTFSNNFKYKGHKYLVMKRQRQDLAFLGDFRPWVGLEMFPFIFNRPLVVLER